MKDTDLINWICHQLDNSSQQISPNVQRKLANIRQNVVKKTFNEKIQKNRVGHTLILGQGLFQQRLVAIISTLCLISLIATYGAWVHEKNEDDQGYIDARLLASELPLQAFTTPELSQWLEN